MRNLNNSTHEPALLKLILAAALTLKDICMPGACVNSGLDVAFTPSADWLGDSARQDVYALSLGSLNHDKRLVAAQCTTLLAWHDLCHRRPKRAFVLSLVSLDLINTCGTQVAQQSMGACKINGIDVWAIEKEELLNMKTINDLTLLVFTLKLGSSPVTDPYTNFLNSNCTPHQSCLWALDQISGNVSHVEQVERASCTLQFVRPTLEALKRRNARTTLLRRSSRYLEGFIGPEIDWLLRTASTSVPQSNQRIAPVSRSAGIAVLFSALACCFHGALNDSDGQEAGQLEAFHAAQIIRICATTALQMRAAFNNHDSEAGGTELFRAWSTDSSGRPLARQPSSATGFEVTCEIQMALTMLESASASLAWLLSHHLEGAIEQKVFSNGLQLRLSLSSEARDVVKAKVEGVLGMLGIFRECLEYVPTTRSKRIVCIEQRLASLAGTLEAQGIEADISFAYDLELVPCADVSSESAGAMLNFASDSTSSTALMPFTGNKSSSVGEVHFTSSQERSSDTCRSYAAVAAEGVQLGLSPTLPIHFDRKSDQTPDQSGSRAGPWMEEETKGAQLYPVRPYHVPQTLERDSETPSWCSQWNGLGSAQHAESNLRRSLTLPAMEFAQPALDNGFSGAREGREAYRDGGADFGNAGHAHGHAAHRMHESMRDFAAVSSARERSLMVASDRSHRATDTAFTKAELDFHDGGHRSQQALSTGVGSPFGYQHSRHGHMPHTQEPHHLTHFSPYPLQMPQQYVTGQMQQQSLGQQQQQQHQHHLLHQSVSYQHQPRYLQEQHYPSSQPHLYGVSSDANWNDRNADQTPRTSSSWPHAQPQSEAQIVQALDPHVARLEAAGEMVGAQDSGMDVDPRPEATSAHQGSVVGSQDVLPEAAVVQAMSSLMRLDSFTSARKDVSAADRFNSDSQASK
ncbi:hypothetical protein BCV70DRAFT_202934 [Testicularia cyperi]|uniref:Uncharacterized protein n=1 Tax=Testicularia cyperi TaxID=1882483 RepID=A0A317XHR5_9BASI|nr:hypothetical protein BCV70DRAFT_202934 [Testicularia cyperi]